MSRLILIDSLSEAGNGAAPNEDAFGYTDIAAWVIDGGTGLADSPLLRDSSSDAAWLASAFNSSFDTLLRSQPLLPLDQMVEAAIHNVADQFEKSKRRDPADPVELPSASMVLVRVHGGHIEYARLGDCRFVTSTIDSDTAAAGEGDLQRLDKQVLTKMTEIRRRSPSLPFAEIRKAVDSDLRRNRRRANQPGGYWALGLDPVAAHHMQMGRITLGEGPPLHGLLVSYGFYRLVDTFQTHDHAALMKAAVQPCDLRPLLARLRNIELHDPECHTLRFKQHNDATAVLVAVE